MEVLNIMRLSSRFILDNLFLLAAAFLVVASMTWSAGVAGWIAFGVSAAITVIAGTSAVLTARSRPQARPRPGRPGRPVVARRGPGLLRPAADLAGLRGRAGRGRARPGRPDHRPAARRRLNPQDPAIPSPTGPRAFPRGHAVLSYSLSAPLTWSAMDTGSMPSRTASWPVRRLFPLLATVIMAAAGMAGTI